MKIKEISVRIKLLVGFMAVIVAGLIIYAGISISNNMGGKVDSIISIDVNPSIEIKTDSNNVVLEVSALNEDAKIILEGMDLKNTDLTVAINAIIGSMVKNGYIDEVKNAFLISVDNEDAAKAQEITELVTGNITDSLAGSNITPVVYSQQFSEDSTISDLASQYGISESKAEFISKLMELDTSLDVAQLAGMKIYELKDLIEEKNIDTSNAGIIAINQSNDIKDSQQTEDVKAEDSQEVEADTEDAIAENEQENESETEDVKVEDEQENESKSQDVNIEDSQNKETETEDVKVEDSQEEESHSEDVKVEEEQETETESEDVKIEDTHEEESNQEDNSSQDNHEEDSHGDESHDSED